MTTSRTSSPPQAAYEAVEAAVMETARGRWFLAEYARRHRAADTAAVLEAIARLEATLAASPERQAAVITHSDSRAPGEVDLTEVAERLLRGARSLDWSEFETFAAPDNNARGEAVAEDPWAPEAEEPSPPVAEPVLEADLPVLKEALPSSDEEPAVPEEEIAAWEAELGALDEAPAADEMDEVSFFAHVAPAVAAPVAEIPPAPPRPLPAARSTVLPRPERPLPPRPQGPRIDDPTLAMTRDEKLALFS